MTFRTNARRVFVPACFTILASVLYGQTAQPMLKGNYILAEEGSEESGAVASLALLTFGEDGSVAGKQLFRNDIGTQSLDLVGDYTFDGINIGSLTLNTSGTDAEGNSLSQTIHYRFAFSATRIQAIRADTGVLSVAYALPAQTGLAGSFVFTELRMGASTSRVVSMTVDELGNVTGTSVVRRLGEISVSNVSGNYSAGENGIGTLTFISDGQDEEGNTVIVTETYASLSAGERAVMLRTDGGSVGLTILSQ